MRGKFLTDRDIFKNDIFFRPKEYRLFTLLYGNAVWQKEGILYCGRHLECGQYIRSYRKLQDDLKYLEDNTIKYYSLRTIKLLVDKLIQRGRITIEKTELGTLFTVCNYVAYQQFTELENGVAKQQRNSSETVAKQQRNSSETAAKQQRNKNKHRISIEKHRISIEKQNITKSKEEDKKGDKSDDFLIFKNIMDLWNNFICDSKYDISKLVSIEKSRKTKLIAAAKKYKETPENLVNRIIEKIKRSEFLQFKKYPKVNFDYCIGSDNIRRIFEGEFDNKKKGDNYGKSKLPTTIDPKTDYTIPPGGPGGAFTT